MEVKPWFRHNWIANDWSFSALLFFSISTIFRGEPGIKIGPKVLTLGLFLFHKNSNPLKNFQTMFLFARVLPLVRISTMLDHIWELGSKNFPKRAISCLLNWYAKFWKFIIEQPQMLYWWHLPQFYIFMRV